MREKKTQDETASTAKKRVLITPCYTTFSMKRDMHAITCSLLVLAFDPGSVKLCKLERPNVFVKIDTRVRDVAHVHAHGFERVERAVALEADVVPGA